MCDHSPAAIVPQAVAQLTAATKVPQPVAQMTAPSESILWAIPCGHHAVLMEKVSDLSARRWYMEQTLANGWSRNVLLLDANVRRVPAALVVCSGIGTLRTYLAALAFRSPSSRFALVSCPSRCKMM